MYDELLQEIIQLNFLPLCIIMYLVVFLIFNDAYEHRLTLMFTAPLILLLLLVFVDNLDYYFLNKSNTGAEHVAAAVAGYNIRIYLMLSLILAALREVRRQHRLLLFIPAIVNTIVTCMAFFTKLVFWYGKNGEIQRGALSFTPHIVALCYSGFLFLFAVRVLMYGRKNESAIIALMVGLTLAGTFVETFFQLRGILIGVIAMNVAFYYLYIHIEHYKIDVLTGALNRNSFDADVNALDPSAGIEVFSVDLNDLKLINDTQGHLAGDEAIKAVVHDLRRVLNPYLGKYSIYRVGGDEFAVICKGMSHEDIENVSAALARKLKDAHLTYSAGHSVWNVGESFETAYSRADRNMYEIKRKYKKDQKE